MPASHAAYAVLQTSSIPLKMEDRKRSLVMDPEEAAPSRKRLLKDEHGQQMRMDMEKEKDVEVSCTFIIYF